MLDTLYYVRTTNLLVDGLECASKLSLVEGDSVFLLSQDKQRKLGI